MKHPPDDSCSRNGPEKWKSVGNNFGNVRTRWRRAERLRERRPEAAWASPQCSARGEQRDARRGGASLVLSAQPRGGERFEERCLRFRKIWMIRSRGFIVLPSFIQFELVHSWTRSILIAYRSGTRSILLMGRLFDWAPGRSYIWNSAPTLRVRNRPEVHTKNIEKCS